MKDPLLAEYTEEELMVEYLVHAIKKNPAEEFPQRSADGLALLTGDALADTWQRQAAAGEDVDIESDLAPGLAAALRKLSADDVRAVSGEE